MIINTNRIALALVVMLASSSVGARELTISYWGGSSAEQFKKHVAEPFEKATGVTVRISSGLASERLAKLIATKGRGADIVYLTDYQMAEANSRGLLEQATPANLSNLSNLYEFARDPLGGGLCPAITVAGVGLTYNKNHFAEPPKTWADLFRDDLRGKSGYPDLDLSYGPLMLIKTAQLNGGGIDDIDPAFVKLKAFKKRLQLFARREILESLNQGDVSIAPQLNIFVAKDESVPMRFAWPQDGGLAVLNLACVVKGSSESALAQKFIDFHLAKEAQEKMLLGMGETPVNKTASIPDGLPFNYIAASDIKKLQFFGVDTILARRKEWLQRWREEILVQ